MLEIIGILEIIEHTKNKSRERDIIRSNQDRYARWVELALFTWFFTFVEFSCRCCFRHHLGERILTSK